MDQKKLDISFFQKACDNCLSYLENFDETTYASILLYKNGELESVRSNGYNNWNVVFFEQKQHEDCVLMGIAEKLTSLKDNETTTILWDEVIKDEKSLKINELRKNYNIFNGISLIHKLNEIYSIVISVCSNKETQPDVFQGKIIFSRKKIINLFSGL